MNFLRRLLGRGQDAATSTMDQATTAHRDPGAHLPAGAQAASSFAASAPADTATSGDLPPELSPDSLSKFAGAIQQLDPEQLQSATKDAIDNMPETTKTDLFSKAQSYLETRGTSTAQSTAIAEHDTGALSQVLTGLMKEGPSSLSDLFSSTGGATAASTASGGGGAGISGLVNEAAGTLGGEDGGFASLLSNPLARQVLAFLVPAVLGAIGKRG